MYERIGLAIIGCGRMGRMHLDILSKTPSFQIKAIVDPNVSQEIVEKYGMNIVTSDLSAVLTDPEVTAVLIATPSAQHIDMIKACAKAKKHIFCEKPVSFSPKDIKEVMRLVDANGLKCQIGFNRRYDHSLSLLRENVMDGVIGNIHLINVVNRDPKRPALEFIPQSGGLFLDFNVHDFDTIRYVTGQKIKSVFAMGANLVDPKIGELGDIDTNTITVELENGALCSIDSSREAVYGYDQRIEVFGAKGSLSSQWHRNHEVMHLDAKNTMQSNLKYSFVERYEQAYFDQILAFRDYLLDDITNPAGLEDAMFAVMAAQAASLSFKLGKEINMSAIVSEQVCA